MKGKRQRAKGKGLVRRFAAGLVNGDLMRADTSSTLPLPSGAPDPMRRAEGRVKNVKGKKMTRDRGVRTFALCPLPFPPVARPWLVLKLHHLS